MIKRWLILIVMAMLPTISFAQSTTVSGTVSDTPDAQTWNNGTVTASFNPNPNYPSFPSYVWTGGTLNLTVSGTLSGTGTYSVSVPSNTAISPQGSTWSFKFCPQATATCFNIGSVTITGATQTLNATPSSIRINWQNPPSTVLAYTDTEASTGAGVGATYFSLNLNSPRICQAATGNSCTTWASAGGGGGATPGPTFTASPACNGAANCFPIQGDTQYIWDGTTVNTQNTISCPNSDCNFTSADDGKLCFATNAPLVGFTGQTTAVVVLPEGTFTHTGAQSGTCSGGNATASLTGTAVFFWGHPDTTTGAGGGTDLIAAAWNATVAACGTLHFGGINKQGTGPLMLWLEQPEFNTGTSITLPTGNATCGAGSEGNRRGITMSGTDINSTYHLIAPNMAYTNCPANGCWLTVADGGNWHDFTMWGAGVSNGTSLSAGHNLICINCVAGGTSGNNVINNVRLMGLGAAQNVIGINVQGGINHASHLEVDGWGGNPCNFSSTVGSYDFLYCGDNAGASASSVNFSGGFSTITNSKAGPSTGATSNIMSVHTGAVVNDYGTQVNDFNTGITGNGTAVYINGGTWNVFGGTIISQRPEAIFLDTSGTARLSGTKATSTGTGSFGINNSSGTVIDLGGNTFSGATGAYTTVSGTTLIADGHSLKAVCTGTVTASTTVALLSTGTSLTGTGLTTACTGTTLDKGIAVNGARTLQTLTCTSSATTVAVVCTVMTSHNGGAFASSGITCTMTAATFCIDNSHTLVLGDGDFVTIQAAGGAAETGANIKAFVEWN